MKAKSKTWNSIVEFYGALNSSSTWNAKHLENLASQIMKSKYAKGLFPVTSMYTLFIGQTPEYDLERGALKVELKKNEIHLELVSSGISARNWKRVVAPEDAYAAICKLIESEKWFVKYDKGT